MNASYLVLCLPALLLATAHPDKELSRLAGGVGANVAQSLRVGRSAARDALRRLVACVG
jgi:hypothetical protein